MLLGSAMDSTDATLRILEKIQGTLVDISGHLVDNGHMLAEHSQQLARIDGRLEGIDGRLEEHSRLLEHHGQLLEHHGQLLEHHGVRLDSLETHAVATTQALERLHVDVALTNETLGVMSHRLLFIERAATVSASARTRLEARVDDLARRVETLESER